MSNWYENQIDRHVRQIVKDGRAMTEKLLFPKTNGGNGIVDLFEKQKNMKAVSKSEWFELDKPIGEPKIAEKYREETYVIERIVREDGEVVWFGQETNWVLPSGSDKWTRLADVGSEFIPCEEPIYETMYKKLNSK